MMKNLLAFFGILFLLTAAPALFMLGRWQFLDKSGEYYARHAISKIFSSMSFSELSSRADARLYGDMPEAELEKIFNSFSQLGEFKAVKNCRGYVSFNRGEEIAPITAEYACLAEFAKDTPTIVLILTGNYANILKANQDASWKISGMHVSSDYLLAQAAPRKSPPKP